MPSNSLLPLPAKKPINIWKYLFFALAGVILLLQTALFWGDRTPISAAGLGTSTGNGPSSYRVSSHNQHSIQIAALGNTWIETVSPGSPTTPRVFIIHNLATPAQCAHLIELGKKKGMERAKILPYGQKELVESTTRTNTGAWLDYQQDDVVTAIENKIAQLTRTTPSQGESMQILHYEPGQQFQVHHDFFDPETDPPENFNPGGNRMATVVLYLHAAEVGGETYFEQLDEAVLPNVGDAVLFYDMNPDGSVDRNTMHAGKPPVRGEKWVMSKWIHERPYQVPKEPIAPAIASEVV